MIFVILIIMYIFLVIYIVVYGVVDGFFLISLSVIFFIVDLLKIVVVIGWEMMLVLVFLFSGLLLVGKNYFC